MSRKAMSTEADDGMRAGVAAAARVVNAKRVEGGGLRERIDRAVQRGRVDMVVRVEEIRALLADRDELWDQVQDWQKEAHDPGFVRAEHDPDAYSVREAFNVRRKMDEEGYMS